MNSILWHFKKKNTHTHARAQKDEGASCFPNEISGCINPGVAAQVGRGLGTDFTLYVMFRAKQREGSGAFRMNEPISGAESTRGVSMAAVATAVATAAAARAYEARDHRVNWKRKKDKKKHKIVLWEHHAVLLVNKVPLPSGSRVTLNSGRFTRRKSHARGPINSLHSLASCVSSKKDTSSATSFITATTVVVLIIYLHAYPGHMA